MKTVKHEIKLERSVKIILGVFALGILLHAFPIIKKGFFAFFKTSQNHELLS